MAELTAAERRKRFEANREMCKEFLLNEKEIKRLEDRNKVLETTVKDFLMNQDGRQVECGPNLWLKLVEKAGSLGKKAVDWLKNNGHDGLIKIKESIDTKALMLAIGAGEIKESQINRLRGNPTFALVPVFPGVKTDEEEM